MELLDLALSSISFLTNREKKLLKKNIDSLDILALLSIEDISLIIGRKTKGEWNGPHIKKIAYKAEAIMDSKNIQGLVLDQDEYPVMLRTINDPPYCLFYRGNIEVLKTKKCVSVVGTRCVCQETAIAAYDFAKEVASDSNIIVSGLANGIDTFAHKGALQSQVKGGTAAILPCGIDSVVPYSNRNLASAILKNGGLLCSEYTPGTPAQPWRFVQRNRLIAALSPVTVVIHAPLGSGALITADFAISYNRDLVFHKAGFCDKAKETNRNVNKQVKRKAFSAEQYVLEGAPIIENYADFIRVMKSPPGTFSVKDSQLKLFS